MRLECVVVCADYADYLGHTLPLNKRLFDRMVVVTPPEDLSTQRVCEFHHVETVLTDSLGTRWGDFCKGCGINDGLGRLGLDGWVLHLDADMVLPPLTREILEKADLDPSMIYGADRHMIPDYATWQEHVALPRLQQEDDVYVHTDAFPLGTRIATSDFGGYIPIGYFQLWNPSASGIRSYPEKHTDAGRSDMVFACQWPRRKRMLLPEIIALHLQSEPLPQGANWGGRTSAPFGGQGVLPPANQLPRHRKHRCDPDHHHHDHDHHHHRHHYRRDDD